MRGGDPLAGLRGERFNGWWVHLGYKAGDEAGQKSLHLVQRTEHYGNTMITVWALVDPENGYVRASQFSHPEIELGCEDCFIGFRSENIWISVVDQRLQRAHLLPLHSLLTGDNFEGVFFLFPQLDFGIKGEYRVESGRAWIWISAKEYLVYTLLHEIGHRLQHEELQGRIGPKAGYLRDTRRWNVFLERGAEAFVLIMLRRLGARSVASSEVIKNRINRNLSYYDVEMFSLPPPRLNGIPGLFFTQGRRREARMLGRGPLRRLLEILTV